MDVLFVLGCFFAFYTFLGAGTNGGVLSCVILSVTYVPKLLDSWMRRFYKELSAMSADSYRNNLLLKKMVEHHTTPISKEEATHETQVA
ncbi:hypothetical protein GCM10008938_37780 [Deinococcus roseus]|uniref:ABC transmembrane type-1 domain-containing protein n=1 Tax=Deinococcus roseus TaxID=392414 RepID=A0ABQ2D801_9DEIO|nr:hypothetical protein GCM10008938_37780 [Deinococcus roseus]